MTKISYIHSVPQHEFKDRGTIAAAAGSKAYIPYLSLTAGEMQLDILLQRMKLYQRFYPEVKSYGAAVNMLQNTLNSGLHKGINFVGSIPDDIQWVAQIIAKSVLNNQPAAGGTLFARNSFLSGIGEVTSEDRAKACAKRASEMYPGKKGFNKRQAAITKCNELYRIEQLYNDRIEGVAHHTLYNYISEAYTNIPNRTYTKSLLHNAGIEGMANAAELEPGLLRGWVENGVLARNAAEGAGVLGSIPSSFYLSPNPEADLQAYIKWTLQRGGAEVHGIGNVVAVALIIVKILAATVPLAFTFLTNLQKIKLYAMAEARGFGTEAFSASKNDWITSQNNPTVEAKNKNTLTYLMIGAGAFFLLNDD